MFNSFPTIHIYELPFKDIISVKLNKVFLLKLFSKLKQIGTSEQIYNKIEINKSYYTFKNYLKLSYSYFLPLDVVIELCNLAKIPLKLMEANIISYQTLKGHVCIINPVLPIKVSPIFDMLLSHLIADGNIVKFKNKNTIYSSYRQYNDEIRRLFLIKSEKVFGKFEYKSEYFKNGTKIYLPEIPTLIILYYYNLECEDILSKKARIPKMIFSKSEDFLVSILTAFIIDEGNVDSSGISIRLCNKKLVKDLQKISNILGYKPRFSESNQLYGIYFRVDETKNLFSKYIKLKKKFPEISMKKNEYKLKLIVDRTNKELKSEHAGSTKNKIVKLLKNKDMTIIELSRELNLTRQGVRFHTFKLVKNKIVSIKTIGRSGSLCHLEKEIYFDENKNKSFSRPIGRTKSDILNILLKSNLTATELASILRIDITNIRIQLNKLENEGQISNMGKDGRRYLWGIR